MQVEIWFKKVCDNAGLNDFIYFSLSDIDFLFGTGHGNPLIIIKCSYQPYPEITLSI